MKRSNLLKAIIFTIFTLVLLAACSTDNDVENDPSNNNNNNSNVSKEKESGGELIVGMTADPDTLNPLVSNTTPGNWINSAIYPHLMFMDTDYEKKPYLAEDYEVSDDGLVVTFTLRDDVKWQDGTPITSEDVKFTGEILHEHQLEWTAEIFDQVESVETPDDHTIVYTLQEPYPAFPAVIGYWLRIVPKQIRENIEDPRTCSNDEHIGARPFKLDSREKGQHVEPEAVDEWFAASQGNPLLDKVTYKMYPDINTMMLALQSGEIDVTAHDIPTSAIGEFENDDRFEVVTTPSLGYAYYSFNLDPDEPSPTQDKN